MSLTHDAELQELFRQEIGERIDRLIDGARAMAEGSLTEETIGTMFREGHTIKGTARVMGFEAVSRAGQIMEAVWREVSTGAHRRDPTLGSALEQLCREVIAAVDSDPVQGTPELRAALAQVSAAQEPPRTAPDPPRPVPPPPSAAASAQSPGRPAGLELEGALAADAPPAAPPPGASEAPSAAVRSAASEVPLPAGPPPDVEGPRVPRVARQESPIPDGMLAAMENSELGGLLHALDTWASEETARVNAADLFRLINTVAAIGVETDGLRELLLDLSDTAPANSPAFERISRLAAALESVTHSITSAKDLALTLASAQLKEVTNTFGQLVRYLAKKTGKEIRFELVGDDIAIDRQVLERIADPLRQLIVNAVEHGVESVEERVAAGKVPTATLSLHARVKDHRLEVVIADDGRGVDWGAVHRTAVRRGLLPSNQQPSHESLRSLLFAPGFSTAVMPSELIGDGSGLTEVASAIEALHGSLRLDTEPGQGTKITLATPTSRALQNAIIVRAAGHDWGIPETAVVDIVPLDGAVVTGPPQREELDWQGRGIPVASFARAVGLAESDEAGHAVILSSPAGPVALTVPAVHGEQEVAAKELGPLIGGAPHLTGAALLGGGDVVVLVDPSRVAERVRELPLTYDLRPLVLVVDDSPGARQVVAAALSSSGFETCVAGGVSEALNMLDSTRVDALVVDFSMPGSDGVSLIEAVRAQSAEVPIVMMSGVATPEDQDRARHAGANMYFDKADFREGALASSLRALVTGDYGPDEVA